MNEFNVVDLDNEIETINKTLCEVNRSIDDIYAIITVNREHKRSERLKNQIGSPKTKIVTSRHKIGHTGGTDILFNLNEILRETANEKIEIVMSASGFGYTWCSLFVEIEKRRL